MFWEKGRQIVQVVSLTFSFYFHEKPSQDDNTVWNEGERVGKFLNSLTRDKDL